MNIELSDELIGGLLGGGVAGTIIGGLITLWAQGRAFRREDRYRFNDIKREKYSDVLTRLDAAFEALKLRNDDRERKLKKAHVPTLPYVDPIIRLGEQVIMLTTPGGETAVRQLQGVLRWAADEDGLPPFRDCYESYIKWRFKFLDEAKLDLGLRRRWLSWRRR
jgi:hypothetical protein